MQSAIPSSDNPKEIAVSPSRAAELAGIGRTSIYAAIGNGSLRSLKIGRRRLILIEWLREWLASNEVS